MQKNIYIVLFCFGFLLGSVQSQTINLIFTAQDSITMDPVSLDSVMVHNITASCDTVIYGPSPSLLLVYPTVVDEYMQGRNDQLNILPPFPNPSHGTAYFEITLQEPGPVEVSLFNISGVILHKCHLNLQAGLHLFKVESSENTILFLRASTVSYSSTVKLINIGNGSSGNMISYMAYKQMVQKSESYSDYFVFSPGDQLSYTSAQQGYYWDNIIDIPLDDTVYNFILNPVIDGWYIIGASTAYQELNKNSMMQITRNEITQQTDSNLFELYIPVIAGDEGFNIVEVAGSSLTTYGPDTDFLTVLFGLEGEPLIPFQRGSYTESINPFTVPFDGMYHVAIYNQTRKVVVVPVHWGMIGAATYNLWNSSVPMIGSPFDLFTMSWTIDSIDLMNGEWKYRYSDGWKVFLDTTVNLGGGITGVSVNANLGESVDSLVPGGNNIVNNLPGIYTSTLEYILGSGYQASLTFIDSLQVTPWTGVICDAVGPGISSDNPSAIPDPSSWNWGNRIIADNGGVPSSIGNLYTWTWTSIILEAYEGFKLRTLNGLPSPVNNMYFDAGYLDLNVAASAPEIIDGGPPNHNLIATVKASYTIVLHIDAANNNEREIIITMD